MKFPAVNISKNSWIGEEENLDSFILFDEFNYNRNEKTFREFYLWKEFCDSNGDIYRIVGRILPEEKWRTWLSFLPNVYRTTFTFEKTGETKRLADLKQFLLHRIDEIRHLENNQGFNLNWKNEVRLSETFEEAIWGKRYVKK